jgi:hypothetical protein
MHLQVGFNRLANIEGQRDGTVDIILAPPHDGYF